MESSQVKERLVARSETRTIEQLQQRGRRHVQIIRADHVAEMIGTAIDEAIGLSNLISRSDAVDLVEQTRAEFVSTVEAQQQEIESLRAKLSTARKRLAQFSALIGGEAALPEDPPPQPAAPTADPTSGAADVLSSAVTQLSSAMNDRLDQMSKKLGISTAVEAGTVNLGGLFKHDADEAPVESNIGDFEVKKKTSGGIAANLERLKKLKGGD